MTTISSLNTAALATAMPSPDTNASSASTDKPALQDAISTPPSTIVTLGKPGSSSSSQLYSVQGVLPNTAPTVTWARTSNDAVTVAMATNYQLVSLSDRFKGLGSALLSQFQTTGGSFAQSVQVATAGALGGQGVQADVTLTVQTKSGAKVDLVLHSQKDGLSVSVKSSGVLTDDEKSAVAKLSDGFQKALDGLSADSPTLDLTGLMQFDQSILSSVDLKSSVMKEGQAVQSINFHADSSARTVSVSSVAGTLKVNVDMSKSAIWGNQSQRAEAISNYLEQFDQAGSRGHGDDSLMAMFKDAFTQMNSSYGTSTEELPGTLYAPAVSKANHALLTGLADFNASITGTAASPNPRHLDEKDTFSYQVSQSTDVRGNLANGTISQTQQSRLNASYHMPLSADMALILTADKTSQSYYYTEINDTASSTTSIENKGWRLVHASLSQSASQSTHQLKYEMGDLISDVTTPAKESQSQDLLALLKPFFENGEAARDSKEWESTLSDLHSKILLQPTPSRLKTQAGNFLTSGESLLGEVKN